MGRPRATIRLVAMIGLLVSSACIGKRAGEPPPRNREASPDSESVAEDVTAAEPTEEASVGLRARSAADSPAPDEASLIETGDLVFAECASKHARALQAVMPGEVNHVGVAFVTAKGPEILAAEEIVAQIPYDQWLRRCRPTRVVIKRLRDAPTALAKDRLRPLQQFSIGAHGRRYDLAFDWEDERLYSSEYVRKAFAEGPQIELGRMQTPAELGVAAATIEDHNRRHETKLSLQTSVVSPSSIMADGALTTVFDSKP